MNTSSEKIASLLRSGRSHAVLLYGAEGSAVDRLAQQLAVGWLCTSLQDGVPCGECRSCQAAARGNHVDLKTIVPRGKSAIIKIVDITDRQPRDKEDEHVLPLQEFFRTPPLLSNRKVVIIQSADRMNEPAANSLLKILEEPHPYAKLVLTTTALSNILPTILSRCLNIPVEMGEPNSNKSAAEAIIEEVAAAIQPNVPSKVLWLSERLRDASEAIEKNEGVGARIAHSRATFALASSLLMHHPDHPEWAQAAIEAHRRIVGNGNASLLFDTLFAGIVS